jgi:hypothetical protein
LVCSQAVLLCEFGRALGRDVRFRSCTTLRRLLRVSRYPQPTHAITRTYHIVRAPQSSVRLHHCSPPFCSLTVGPPSMTLQAHGPPRLANYLARRARRFKMAGGCKPSFLQQPKPKPTTYNLPTRPLSLLGPCLTLRHSFLSIVLLFLIFYHSFLPSYSSFELVHPTLRRVIRPPLRAIPRSHITTHYDHTAIAVYQMTSSFVLKTLTCDSFSSPVAPTFKAQ